MSQTDTELSTGAVEPLPANITSVQPGGGVCYRIELGLGSVPAVVSAQFPLGLCAADGRDAAGRHGRLPARNPRSARSEVLPQSVYGLVGRGGRSVRLARRIPFARWGLAELQIMGWPLLVATVALAASRFWPAAIVTGVVLALMVYFFRDPPRRVPHEAGLMVAPADGRIAEIARLDSDPFIGGPAVRIGIFLSIFNVHINRVPCRSRVLCLRYSPGKFLNALKPESAWENENMWIGLEDVESSRRRLVVRQIAGQFARRIVCSSRPGETLERGAKFGMIKLGSRTELILPSTKGLEIVAQVGQRVRAGSSVLAKYTEET